MGGLLRLIAGGVLAIPALLVTVVTAPIVALLSVPAAWCLLAHKPRQETKPQQQSTDQPPTRRHRQVIVTGGSSGIGLAIAKCAALDDSVARVVIVARNRERLQAARAAILAAAAASQNNGVQVEARSVDVADAAAVEAAMSEIMKNSDDSDNSNNQKETSNYTTHLFCCAGEPHPSHFRDNTAADYARVTRTNQLGSIYAAQAALRHMAAGTVTLCSSVCGQIGVFGYAAYAPTKFALRGYAECLSAELCNCPHLHVQVAYPPDTDTPGFAAENLRKPRETALVSEMAGLADPRVVGRTMWREAIRKQPRFSVSFNLDGWLLCQETAGFAPVTTLADCVAQVSLLNLARWIALFYLAEWHRLIRNHQNGGASETTTTTTTNPATTSHSSSSSSSNGGVKED